MSKRSTFTTVTPLPAGVSREVVLAMLHNHQEMIDLNPLVKERHPIEPPSYAPADEQACQWYSLTDSISYFPGVRGDVTYTCAFHQLPTGLQTHCYAPAGLDIRDKWTVNGSLAGEPSQPVELGIGAPRSGLYLREDVDMRCNVVMSGFVKRTLKKSHAALVARLQAKAGVGVGAGVGAGPSKARPTSQLIKRAATLKKARPASLQLPLPVPVRSSNAAPPAPAPRIELQPAPDLEPRPTQTDPRAPTPMRVTWHQHQGQADRLQTIRQPQQQQQQHEKTSPDPTSAYPPDSAVWTDIAWPPAFDQHPDYPQLNPYSEEDEDDDDDVDRRPPTAPSHEPPPPPESPGSFSGSARLRDARSVAERS